MYTEAKDVQLANTPFLITMVLPLAWLNVMDVNAEQFANALPSTAAFAGITILLRLVQFWNAAPAIRVTPEGRLTLWSPEHPLNPSTVTTVFGIVTDVTPVQPEKAPELTLVTVLPLSVLGTVTAPVGLVPPASFATPVIAALPLLRL
jgi:hypothetical protein